MMEVRPLKKKWAGVSIVLPFLGGALAIVSNFLEELSE